MKKGTKTSDFVLMTCFNLYMKNNLDTIIILTTFKNIYGTKECKYIIFHVNMINNCDLYDKKSRWGK